MNRFSNFGFQLKQWFWIGLYANCWSVINQISRVSDFAARHIQKAPNREDGYSIDQRYPWRKR